MRQLTSSAALLRKSRWTFSVSRNPSDIWTRFSLYCSLTPCTPCYWNISDLQINLILNTLDIAECVLSRFLGIWRVLHVRLISDSWLMVIGDRYLDHCYSPTFMFLRIPPPPQIVSEEIRPDQSMHTLHLESLFTHILRVPYQCFLFWSVIRYLLCFGCIVMEALFFCVLKHADHSQWITSQLLFCQSMLCLMLSFMYNKQLHGTKNGPNFLSIVSFVVPEMMHTKC